MSDKKQATSDKTSDYLLPCPFCGGEAEFYRTAIKTNGSWCDSVVVKCKECEARTGRILYDAQKHPNDKEYDEAAVLWNTRKPVDALLDEFKIESDAYKDLIELHSVAGNWHMAHIYAEKARAMADAIEIIKENLT